MRDERAFLFDMLDSANLAIEYISDITFDDFWESMLIQDAIVHRLVIIGEAAKHISEATRASLPSLPFNDMARMRDKMTHVYWRVDLRIVWETVTRDLPRLIAAITPLMPPPSSDNDSETRPS